MRRLDRRLPARIDSLRNDYPAPSETCLVLAVHGNLREFSDFFPRYP